MLLVFIPTSPMKITIPIAQSVTRSRPACDCVHVGCLEFVLAQAGAVPAAVSRLVYGP